MEFVVLVGGERIYCHPKRQCAGQRCSIHNPTYHSMKDFPQHWRYDREIVERICEHGIGHPDPDDFSIRMKFDSGVHGCDGCCDGAYNE